MDKRLKRELENMFMRLKAKNTVSGSINPSADETYNLGTATKKWDVVYAREVVVDTLSGGGGGAADTVDGFHASSTPTAGYLLALDGTGVFPTAAYASAILQDGSRALTGNLSVNAGVTIDGIDVGAHDHSGGTAGTQLSHGDLTNLGVDDHAQYTQWAQEEVITALWTFSNTADDLDSYYKYVGWEIETQLTLDGGNDPIPSQTWTKISSIPFSAQVGFEHDYPIEIVAGGDGSYIQIGAAGEVMLAVLESNDYRMWIGNATAANAPFSIDKTGYMKAISGTIGGWTLSSTSLSNNNITLDSSGVITVGDGPTDILKISSVDTNYMFWAGASDPAAALFRLSVGGDVDIASGTITGTLKSDTYVSSQAGWKLFSDGFAEFENVWVRGIINAVVYKENTISVIAGRTLVTDGSAIVVDIVPADTTITIEADVFQQYDLVNIQPDGTRNEWMSIDDDGTPVNIGGLTYYEYAVTRNLNGLGAQSFYIGETIFRKGTASYPVDSGLQFGDFGSAYINSFSAAVGGLPFASLGGFITLDGTREYGPYMGVARRFGATYSQIEDVMRFGRLLGFNGISDNVWGFAAGRTDHYIRFDDIYGLEIKSEDVNMLINKDGFFIDSQGIAHTTTAPEYKDGYLILWVDQSSKTLKGKYKDGSYENEEVIQTF